MRRRVYKRVRFDVDPLLDGDSDTSDYETTENRHGHESMVFEEDPFDATKDLGEGTVLTESDFWDHVYSHVWSGRLRVDEGYLLRTLLRVFDDLIVSRRLGSAEATQYHDAVQLRGRYGKSTHTVINRRNNKQEAMMKDYLARKDKTKYGAFKVVLTFYGGKPMGRRQRVSFDTRANVDTSPRLTRLFPILKGSHRWTQRRLAIDDADKERELTRHAILPIHAKQMQFFVARTPQDFAARCIQAANDFMIVKEQITNSKDWRVKTNITISHKLDTRYRMFRFSTALPRFYEYKTSMIIL